MKTAIFALICLALGIGVGLFLTRQEFAGEKLPTKAVLAVIARKDTDAATKGPRLLVEGGEMHDFGVMDKGFPGEHEFVFRNVGTAPLVVTKGETTCKCTSSSSGGKEWKIGESRTIEPDGKLSVMLSWNAVAKAEVNDFSQAAEFSTNDPDRETVRLLIAGKVVQPVEADRMELVFPSVTTADPAVAEMNIYSYRDDKFQIIQHDWKAADYSDHFAATITPLTPHEVARQSNAKGGVRVRVTIKPGLPVGRIRQRLSLTPNYPGLDPIEIPVSVPVIGDVTMIGPRVHSGTYVNLGVIDEQQGTSLTIYLLVKGPHRDQTTAKLALVDPQGTLKASLGEAITENEKVKRIPVKIEIPPGAERVNYSGSDEGKMGRVVIQLTHPQIRQFTINVQFVVR